MTAIDYKKWDALQVESDDDEDASRAPSRQALPDVDAVAHAYIAAGARAALPDVSDSERDALLGFLKVQDPREHATNVLFCNFIVEVFMQAPNLATKRTLDRACALTRHLCFGEGGADAPANVTPILLSAINTLAACVEIGAINLFSIIATPRGDEAERLRLRYEQKEFGKAYLMDHMGWGDDVRGECDESESGSWWCLVQ
jgi:hypothetical protein